MRTGAFKRWLWLVAVPCAAQPVWTSIADQPSQYFRFWFEDSPRSIERTTLARSNFREFYRFSAGPVSPRASCMILDRAADSGVGGDGPVYWYTPQGVHLDHQFPTPYPSEFTVSAGQLAIRGFAITASMTGATHGGGTASANAYFTNRPCSDGGIEYGLFRDLGDESIAIYWATFANCGNDGKSVCRRRNDSSLGEGFSNIQQENSGHNEHGFRIYGLNPKAKYTFRLFAVDHGFHIEVLSGDRPAECSDRAGGRNQPCTFTRDAGSWFPVAALAKGLPGYMVIGTQTLGNPLLSEDAGFRVTDVAVAK